MGGNPTYSSHFLSSWVAQCDEDAEPSRPSTPTQPPEQRPLHASSLTPSPDAIKTSSQYLTYFPDSWLASLPSSPSPSSSRTSLTPTRLQSPSSIVSRETPKPLNTANSSTSPSLSPLDVPLRPVVTPRSNFRLSQPALWPNSSIPSTARRRNTSWAHRTKHWMTGLRNGVLLQFSPPPGQGRPMSQEQKYTTRQPQHTDRRSVPSWMQLQQDLEVSDLNHKNCKVDHDTNDRVNYINGIGEDDSDEGHGDILHRAPSGSIAYSTRTLSTQ